ncbi:MAG: S8 family serine peptidase, partial [Acidobacteria bacterium]|nr:S8 family serine peptidase [Acidobacteriota bacterium]
MKKQLVIWITLAALAMPVQAVSSKIARDLQGKMDRGEQDIRVIVTLVDGLAARDIEDLTFGRGRDVRRSGKTGINGRLRQFEILDLAADGRVLSISPDRLVMGSMDVAVSASGADAIVQNLGFTGKGITIALIDSGLTPSAAVPAERILADVNFTDSPQLGTLDGLGHGTHIASTIGGSGIDGSVRGVAPNVNFVNLRVLDDEGLGYVSSVIEAIDFAIANRARFNIRVLNMSLGHPVAESYHTDPLARAVERAWAAGLTVIASAGNRGRDGYLTINSPGNDPYVLTIGAMNDKNTVDRSDDIIATYSSRGPSYGDQVVKPDLVAPGNRIVSTLAPGAALADMKPDSVSGDRIELS